MTAVASTRSAIPSAPPGVQLPLHHSHDTPAKQWNKTRVLALAVVARVLRRYPETRIASRAVAGWGRALAAAAAAAAATEPEVAAAGVSAVLDLLSAAAAAAVACTRAVGEAGGGGGGINGGGGGWVSVFLSAAGATANGGTGAVAAAAPAADATPPDADEHLAMATALWHSVWEAIDGVVPVARSVDSPLPPGCDPSPPPLRPVHVGAPGGNACQRPHRRAARPRGGVWAALRGHSRRRAIATRGSRAGCGRRCRRPGPTRGRARRRRCSSRSDLWRRCRGGRVARVEAAPQARTGKSELLRTAWIIPGVLTR